MITNLTPEQEAKIPKYIEKWRQIARSTSSAPENVIQEAIKEIYTLVNMSPPKEIIVLPSPKAILEKTKHLDPVSTFVNLNGWIWWVALYDYLINELNIDVKTEDLNRFKRYSELIKDCHKVLAYEEVCFASQKPVEIHTDQAGRLHNENGFARKYSDNTGDYFLHGIKMSPFIFETPREQIKSEDVLGLVNTEERYQAMKFIGFDKFLNKLSPKVLDKMGDYKLMLLKIEGEYVGPYLEMSCPSTGRKFFEGVGDPETYETVDTSIKTCEDALKFRATKAVQHLLKKQGFKLEYLPSSQWIHHS